MELQWQLDVLTRKDLTLQLWLDVILGDRGMMSAAGERKVL